MSFVDKKRTDGQGSLVWRADRPPAKDWAVFKRYQQGDLLAVLSEDGREVEIIELLMQVYTAPVADSFGNFKLPVIAVAIVLVLGYQYMKQKGRFSGGGGAGSRAWDSHDFSSLRNKRKP